MTTWCFLVNLRPVEQMYFITFDCKYTDYITAGVEKVYRICLAVWVHVYFASYILQLIYESIRLAINLYTLL